MKVIIGLRLRQRRYLYIEIKDSIGLKIALQFIRDHYPSHELLYMYKPNGHIEVIQDTGLEVYEIEYPERAKQLRFCFSIGDAEENILTSYQELIK